MPDTNNTLRADLDALEHTNVAVRSMFRSIQDGVRDHPTPDPARGADLRLIFAALLGDLAAAIQAFGDLARDEGTDHIDVTEDALTAALQTVREARDRIDDLQLIDPGVDNGWELSEPVRQAVERILRDLDLEQRSRPRPAAKSPTKVDPLEMLKAAHQLLHAGPRPAPKAAARTAPVARPAGDPRRPDRAAPAAAGQSDSWGTGRPRRPGARRVRPATGPAGRTGTRSART